MRILYVISDLHFGGAAKQLTLLASGLPAERFQRRVCVHGGGGPWVETLRADGVIVEVLDWRWLLDLPALGRLRSTVRAKQADVIHVWGWTSLRILGLVGALSSGRIIVTNSPPLKGGVRLPIWDRWLLRHAESVTTSSLTEADKWRQSGVNEGRLAIIPPGVEVFADVTSSRRHPVTPSPTILCIGPLNRHKGFRDAVWVLDIVRSIHKEVQIVLAGSGPDRSAIHRFAQAAGVADRVHLMGDQADLSGLLAEADLLWAPSREPGGVNAVLEAMAAGKAVIASRLPGLVEIVVDGETGILVPPGDKAALAQQTRRLLDDPDLLRRMGEAGQRRVQERFAAADTVSRFAALYERKR